MKISLLITLCCVLFLCDQVLAEDENEIRRGVYPFMAFLYYPDESVIEPSGARFTRGAVLVKPDWLISSSVGPMTINDVPLGFPRKTLLARLGAVTIDYKFTLSEDEGEQEREVIEIVRPFNQSGTQWWRTDIALLKTLLPFNITAVVNVGTLRKKPSNFANCFVLIYTRRTGNYNEDKQLMQYFVELTPDYQNCGPHFYEDTMLCAMDNIEYKIPVNSSEFCQGNSGGPLICDKDITGIQTYIENNCLQPHLYQHLSAWEEFITCGLEDKCNDEQCSNMCTVMNKDDDFTKETTTEESPVTTETYSSYPLTEEITLPTTSNEMISYNDLFDTSPTPSTTSATEMTEMMEETTTTTTTTTTSTTTTTTTTPTTTSPSVTDLSEATTRWPKERYPPRENIMEIKNENIERKASVEAQRHKVKPKKQTSAAHRNVRFFHSLIGVCILACLF